LISFRPFALPNLPWFNKVTAVQDIYRKYSKDTSLHAATSIKICKSAWCQRVYIYNIIYAYVCIYIYVYIYVYICIYIYYYILYI
jgi:hypothetical protein